MGGVKIKSGSFTQCEKLKIKNCNGELRKFEGNNDGDFFLTTGIICIKRVKEWVKPHNETAIM